ncbi:MAG: hypothetical protein HC856_08540 [Pseudanabaena sp. RU_4_16]|nr:hypothetical protein [Pseudanabaena sp. SU_2_4]NJM28243.1 hypothetical protein [Pseudanabaena sp. RU_4_16]
MNSVISIPQFPSATQWNESCRAIAYGRFWTIFLVCVGSISNLVYTCTLPFACLGVIAGMTLPRRRAIAAAFLIWTANQACGFTIHNYPHTLSCYAWGIVLLMGTLLITYLANQKPIFTNGAIVPHYLRLGGWLIGGFILFQLVILFAGMALSTSPTAPDVLWQILAGNSLWTAGLTLAHGFLVWDRTSQFQTNQI